MRLEWDHSSGRQALDIEARRNVSTFSRYVVIDSDGAGRPIIVPVDYIETFCAALRAEGNIAMLCKGKEE